MLKAYTILYAALLVPAGRLVDLHGAKRLFLFGVAVFTTASAACGMAPETNGLIAARVVQAVGGAVLTPASLALILGAFPADKRSAIVGLCSAAGALGAAVGPGAGAILIELATWRGIPGQPAVRSVDPVFCHSPLATLKGADAGDRLEFPGIAPIATEVAALTYGVVQEDKAGFAASTVWGPALVGIELLATYAFWARDRKGAAIDMALFADRTYALETVASFVFGIAFFNDVSVVIPIPAGHLGLLAGTDGPCRNPRPAGGDRGCDCLGPSGGAVGHRAVLVAGGVLYAAAQFWVASQMTETAAYWTLWFPMQIVGGIAVGLLLVGLSGAAVAGMPTARFGVGGAVNNAVRQLGGVFGTALAVVLVWVQSMGRAQAAPGLISADARQFSGVHNAVTVWETEAEVRAYRVTGAHLAAMKAFHGIATGQTVGFAAEAPPEWDEVHAIWQTQGREVKRP